MRPVSIHAPVWVRRNRVRGRVDGQVVSIHAPVWVRLSLLHVVIDNVRFQFTHPCGCDVMRILRDYRKKCFNSRTRVGATFSAAMRPISERGFNSRTRVGATGIYSTDEAVVAVSIHAPVWVRPISPAGQKSPAKFQFTHPCGCDRSGERQDFAGKGFNSRTRVGATLPRNLKIFSRNGFNSRTRVGATA